MKKYVIGLGCSFTQGQGAYPTEVTEAHNGRVNVEPYKDDFLRKYEHENSWVNVLCKKHFKDHAPINLGQRGAGNRAAVNEIHFLGTDLSNSTGYVVFMVTSLDRFDFFNEYGVEKKKHPHYKWSTMWPRPDYEGSKQPLWKCYFDLLWSHQFVALETMIAIKQAKMFSDRYGYKFILANSINMMPQGFRKYMEEYGGPIAKQFDWDCYMHNNTSYNSFLDKLIKLDGILPDDKYPDFYSFYHALPKPSKYISNCAHPTILGYEFMADEIANFINK